MGNFTCDEAELRVGQSPSDSDLNHGPEYFDVLSVVQFGDLPIDDEPNRADEFGQWLRVHADARLLRSYSDPDGYYVVRDGDSDAE